jgi:hypothetical protein
VCKAAERAREKVLRVQGSLKVGVASVVKTAVGNTDSFGISLDGFTLIAKRYFNDKDSLSGLQ